MRAIVVTTHLDQADAEAAVRASLAEQGFGVLTEIDIAATLRSKIGVERPPLKILGACNPTFAHRALEVDPATSLLLPCNVVIEPLAEGEGADPGHRTRISAVDPRALMSGPAFDELASAAADRLRAALDAVAAAR